MCVYEEQMFFFYISSTERRKKRFMMFDKRNTKEGEKLPDRMSDRMINKNRFE